jgi:hypothetical protein
MTFPQFLTLAKGSGEAKRRTITQNTDINFGLKLTTKITKIFNRNHRILRSAPEFSLLPEGARANPFVVLSVS